ncbi:hypothetical protein D3C80_1367300 [compost metagenome]
MTIITPSSSGASALASGEPMAGEMSTNTVSNCDLSSVSFSSVRRELNLAAGVVPVRVPIGRNFRSGKTRNIASCSIPGVSKTSARPIDSGDAINRLSPEVTYSASISSVREPDAAERIANSQAIVDVPTRWSMPTMPIRVLFFRLSPAILADRSAMPGMKC